MCQRHWRLLWPLALTISLLAGGVLPFTQTDIPDRAAFRLVELPSWRTIREARSDILLTPVEAGSIAKVATLTAALGEGAITPTTSLPCRRRVVVEGRQLTCVHPDLGRPLTAAEALAYSCNDFFATVAPRVSREALNAALVRLGLAPIPPDRSTVLGALGLAGTRATPVALLQGFVRAVGRETGRLSNGGLPAAVIEGLRGAAVYGTASSLGARGIDALAKTGTAPMPGGGYMGIVVAVAPSAAPSRGVVVVAPGASGREAAEIAARLLDGEAVVKGRTAGSGRVAAVEAMRTGGAARLETSRSHSAQVTIRVGRLREGRTYIVETPAIEDYVAGVVAAEAFPSSPEAALEALAIVARSYALANRGRHQRDGFDLCDLTHCQVVGRPTTASRRATAATAGLVLMDGDRVARVLYTASCGGQLELPSAVWGNAGDDRGYTRRVEPACRTGSAWKAEIAASDLARALAAGGIRGGPPGRIAVLARTPTGLVSTIRLDGFAPSEVSGEEFRLLIGRTLGWALVKSARFDLTRTAHGYRFEGTGRGHLAGMCLEGAAREAAAGASRDMILAIYFPLLRLAPMSGQHPPVRVAVTLPVGRTGEVDEVRDLVARELRSLEKATGQAGPTQLALVFHSSVAGYERATGMPWWTAATTAGARIELLPIDLLRRRAILQGTIRHELAHMLTGPALAGRPRWVREGAAMYFAGEGERRRSGAGDDAGSGGCPPDEAFTRAVSAQQAERAYARARACFAAGLAQTGRWQEVGFAPGRGRD